jgi:hypothetical protein
MSALDFCDVRIRLWERKPCKAPAQAFAEARKIVDGKVEGPAKIARHLGADAMSDFFGRYLTFAALPRTVAMGHKPTS